MRKAKAKAKAKVVHKTPIVRETKSQHMDRKTLKAIVADLKTAGADIKVLKSDDDDALRRKVNETLAALPSPEVLAKLEAINPQKLGVVLGQPDCLGLYIDLRTVDCMVCEDNAACVKKYLENLKGDFSMFTAAMEDIKTETAAAAVTKGVIAAVMTQPAVRGKPIRQKRIKYDAKRAIYVMDIENPNTRESDEYEMLQSVLDQVPRTLKQLRALAEEHYEYKTEEDFVEECVVQLRDIGMIKFWEDLADDERAAYEAAAVAAKKRMATKAKTK
jgi:hypothetical protein